MEVTAGKCYREAAGTLKTKIRALFRANDSTYGYRRMHAALARGGEPCGPELVRALMRELGLVPCQPRPWRPSMTRPGAAGPIPDLVRRDFTAARPGEKMVGDITYSAQLAVMCSPAV
jgi:putative transposase